MSKARTLLVKRRKQILKKLAPFQRELEEVDAMLRIAEANSPVIIEVPANGEKLSIAKQALVILRENRNGLPTREIVEQMAKRFGRKIRTGNLSWHLSHLKGDHRLTQEGENWKIP